MQYNYLGALIPNYLSKSAKSETKVVLLNKININFKIIFRGRFC